MRDNSGGIVFTALLIFLAPCAAHGQVPPPAPVPLQGSPAAPVATPPPAAVPDASVPAPAASNRSTGPLRRRLANLRQRQGGWLRTKIKSLMPGSSD